MADIVGPDMGTTLKSADRLVLDAWADEVKNRRRQLGLSQVEAASRCGITQSTLSKIESGDYRLHPEMILRLCDGLDLDPRHAFAWPPAIVEIARIRKEPAA